MNTFSIKESLAFGWRTFKLRPWFFVSVSLMVLVVSMLSGFLQGVITDLSGQTIGSIASLAISLAVNTFISMGVIALYLKAHDGVGAARLAHLWHPAPFWRYLSTILLLAIGTLIGLILLIIPGIIFALACGFARVIVIDRELSPVHALKESARMTKGKRLHILLFVLSITAINFLGALALLVGLFVTMPVSVLATMHVYRSLARENVPVAA